MQKSNISTEKKKPDLKWSDTQIAAFKQQYGNVYVYRSSDGKQCLLSSPGLEVLDACRTLSGGSSIKFDKNLVENCWIDGDSELRTVAKYQIGLFDWLGGIIDKVEGELEQL